MAKTGVYMTVYTSIFAILMTIFSKWTCVPECVYWTSLYGEHRIVVPGDASWKWLCSLSVPPDDDDDMTVYKVAQNL